MKTQTEMFICIQPDYNGGAWWRYDTLSYSMKHSKSMLLGKGSMTWKECYKLGWRCKRVSLKLETFKD